jgi:hypothetical protein
MQSIQKERVIYIYIYIYICVPFARKPVAPVTKIVLFSRNLGMLSNSMEKKWERQRERVVDDQ